MLLSVFEASAAAIIESSPDVVLYHPKILSAPMAAAKVGSVSVLVELAPLLSPTKEFGAAGVGSGNLGPLNRMTYALVARSSSMFTKDLDALAQRMKATITDPDHSVCLVSSSILDRPADWPPTTHLVGPWLRPESMDRGSQPEATALAFMAQGPTIVAGFGSMKLGDPEPRTTAMINSIRQAGYQALLVTGWGGLKAVEGDGILSLDAVNYATVLPQAAGAIHHGGAGTVHTALRAGVPSVIVPFIADQPWWAARLHRSGLGPGGIPVKRLNESKLARAIEQLPGFAPKVREVSSAMTVEDGVQNTLDLLARL